MQFSTSNLYSLSTQELVRLRDELIDYTLDTLDDSFDKELIAIESILKTRRF